MSAGPIRLAIIGAGTIGTIHGLASLNAPEARVTSIWSRSPDRAKALAARLGATAYGAIDQAIDRADVDAVVICTPTFLHYEHVLAAIRAGKHVICEKPLARDLTHAHAMIQAADAAGVQLHVAHVVRFFPEFRRLHDLIRQGAVGTPAIVRMSRASSFPYGSDEWHNRLELSGGVVLDMGIHDLDWLLWTFGQAPTIAERKLRIYGRGLYTLGLPHLDYALLTLRLQSGVLAHVECSWAEPSGFRVHGEICGDRGMLTYDSLDSTALRIDLRLPSETPPGVNVPTTYTAESPYVSQLRHFARCIQGDETPIITPQEAYDALRLALAALESLRTGEPITLTEEHG